MKTKLFSIFFLLTAAAFGAAAANDLKISQTTGTTPVVFKDRIFPAEGAVGTTLASYLSAVGLGAEDSPTFTGVTANSLTAKTTTALTLTGGDNGASLSLGALNSSNASVTITPKGSGYLHLNTGTDTTVPVVGDLVINSGNYGSTTTTAQLTLLPGWGNNNTSSGFYLLSQDTAAVGGPNPYLSFGLVKNNAGGTAFENGSELARLNYTGNLLLGTTTDDTVNKLQVLGSGAFTGTLQSSSGAAAVNGYRFYSSTGALNAKLWAWQAGSAVGENVLRLRAINDAETDGINAITFTRSGITGVDAAVTGAFTASGTGTHTFGGKIIPATDADKALGDSTHRWSNVDTLSVSDGGNKMLSNFGTAIRAGESAVWQTVELWANGGVSGTFGTGGLRTQSNTAASANAGSIIAGSAGAGGISGGSLYIGGAGTFTAPAITAGSGTGLTVNIASDVRRVTYKATTTYAAFAAAGLTADKVIATLPAKSKLVSVYADVTTPFTGGGATAAAMTFGKTAGGNEYLVSFDVLSGAITRGLADADLGTSINRASAIQGGDMPSWSATTDISARLTTVTANTDQLTAGSITWYLVTESLP